MALAGTARAAAGAALGADECICRACKAEKEDVRIDRYLHCIRLVKSRTLAQTLIETGHVRINGRRVGKPSEDVRIGSIIGLPLHGHVRILKVLSLPERRGPAVEARQCYEELATNGGIDGTKPAT
jgi:ribosome-associated heat shock protein Hsp15